jgi:hypothetical protein
MLGDTDPLLTRIITRLTEVLGIVVSSSAARAPGVGRVLRPITTSGYITDEDKSLPLVKRRRLSAHRLCRFPDLRTQTNSRMKDLRIPV